MLGFHSDGIRLFGASDTLKAVSYTHLDVYKRQELRKERGFTQIKMQMLTGIDQSDYSKLETGKRYYTFEQLKKLALALDTSMDYLAGLTDEKKPYPRRNG